MLQRWKRASHKVQSVSHWKNEESTTSAYTAKASYNISIYPNKTETKGQCIDIDQKKLLLKNVLERKLLYFV